MAKGLIWTQKAKKELACILNYWDERNQSTTYSKKLFWKIRNVLTTICESNYLGRPTSAPNVRVTLIDNYLLFYEITEDDIIVLMIIDGRRNQASRKTGYGNP